MYLLRKSISLGCVGRRRAVPSVEQCSDLGCKLGLGPGGAERSEVGGRIGLGVELVVRRAGLARGA